MASAGSGFGTFPFSVSSSSQWDEIGVAFIPASTPVSIQTNNPSTTLPATTTTTKLPATVESMHVGGYPYGVAVNTQTDRIYVANNGDGTLSVIDGSSNQVISTVPGTSGALEVAVNPNTNMIYVTNPLGNEVFAINGSSNSILSVIPVGNTPEGIAVDSNSNRVFVANLKDNSVSVIDGSSNKAISTIAVGRSPYSVAVNTQTGRVYVTNSQGNTVSVIDGSSNSVTSTLAVGSNPYAVAVNANANKIYVANLQSNTLSVIDGQTNQVTTLGVCQGPSGVAVDPSSNKIYVACGFGFSVNDAPGSLHEYDGTSMSDLGSVTVGVNPIVVAFNPISGYVYVTDNGSNGVFSVAFATSTIPSQTAAITTTNPAAAPAEKSSATVTSAVGLSENQIVELGILGVAFVLAAFIINRHNRGYRPPHEEGRRKEPNDETEEPPETPPPHSDSIVEAFAELDLPPNASRGQIKEKYRSLQKALHSDVNNVGNPIQKKVIEEKLKRVNDAFALLRENGYV